MHLTSKRQPNHHLSTPTRRNKAAEQMANFIIDNSSWQGLFFVSLYFELVLVPACVCVTASTPQLSTDRPKRNATPQTHH